MRKKKTRAAVVDVLDGQDPLSERGVARLSHPSSSKLEEGSAAWVGRAARAHPCRTSSWLEHGPESRSLGTASRLETGTADQATTMK